MEKNPGSLNKSNSAEDLLRYVESNSRVRMVREDSPLEIPLQVIDISLQARGPTEDLEYARDPELLDKV